jgi:hemolysin activation/secretion protein
VKNRKAVISYILFLFYFSQVFSQNIHLEFKGTTEEETRVLDSLNYQKIFSDYQSLKTEIDSMQVRLQHSGYIENRIIETSKISDTLYLSKFDLKKKFYTIYIYYIKTSIKADDLLPISNEVTSQYFAVSIDRTEKILNHLNQLIIDKGLPFASLKLINLKKKDDQNLSAELVVTKTKKRGIDEIVIKGYEKFPRSFIKHFLKIKTNSDFNLNEIKEKTEQLNQLRFANQTRSPEVLFTKDSTALYFYIEKTKSNTFDGFLGFGTNEETNKLEFDGYLNLNLVNSLNFGETFLLNYKSDESDQKTFKVNINMPYIFGSAVGTQLGLNIFKKDSSFTTINQSADIFYQINPSQRLFIGINATRSNNLLELNDQNIEDVNSLMYNVKYEFIKSQYQNYLFPVNFKVLTMLGFGNRTINNTKVDQHAFSIDMFKILNLNLKNSIFLRINGAGIFSDDLYDNELLRFGGINSIRGFEENSLIATLNGVLNTEYRYQLNPSIYLHTIFDAAYLENDISGQRDKLFGFGFGFGILTKAGVLKFNYANGKLEGQNFKFSNSKIHLSLNAIF